MYKALITVALLAALALALGACGAAQPATTIAPTAAADMAGMDHGSIASSDAPFDAQFIDSMIVHHDGAIAMAKQALQEAERPEIKAMAQAIIAAQEQENTQLRAWRDAWYPNLAPTSGMGMEMGSMEVGGDTSTPFDQRFIEAMIPHHESAVAMAKDAQQNAEHQEIKDLAGAIIAAQEAEIAQMKQWQQEWFR
jgi:uncharacterized protein (DUF305 family)